MIAPIGSLLDQLLALLLALSIGSVAVWVVGVIATLRLARSGGRLGGRSL
jgi:hypothetical protein